MAYTNDASSYVQPVTTDAPTYSAYNNSDTSTGDSGKLFALSMVWNEKGAWLVRSAEQLDDASTKAMEACNDKFGECSSAASVDSDAFGCVAIARDDADSTQLFTATGESLEDVRAAVMKQVGEADTTGKVEYAKCNG